MVKRKMDLLENRRAEVGAMLFLAMRFVEIPDAEKLLLTSRDKYKN